MFYLNTWSTHCFEVLYIGTELTCTILLHVAMLSRVSELIETELMLVLVLLLILS